MRGQEGPLDMHDKATLPKDIQEYLKKLFARALTFGAESITAAEFNLLREHVEYLSDDEKLIYRLGTSIEKKAEEAAEQQVAAQSEKVEDGKLAAKDRKEELKERKAFIKKKKGE